MHTVRASGSGSGSVWFRRQDEVDVGMLFIDDARIVRTGYGLVPSLYSIQRRWQ